MKVAAMDLGSNTFLCLICDVEDNQIRKIYHDQIEYVRLSEGLQRNDDEKRFSDISLLRADNALLSFAKAIDLHKPDRVLAMGTSAVRDAINKEELFSIGRRHNIPIEVIPGSREAEITFAGALSNIKPFHSMPPQYEKKSILVIDIGGGSTEFIFGSLQNGKPVIQFAKSFNIGCVRLKEKFDLRLPLTNEKSLSVKNELNQHLLQFAKAVGDIVIDEIIAVAGTPTTVAMAHLKTQNVNEVESFKLTNSILKDWLVKCESQTLDQLIAEGVPSGRADVISVGILTLLESLTQFNKQCLTVSTRGVRHGVALELFQRL